MGTSVMLDILGSLSTFGLLMLAVLRLNAAAGENSYAYNQNYILQRNMVVLTVMLEVISNVWVLKHMTSMAESNSLIQQISYLEEFCKTILKSIPLNGNSVHLLVLLRIPISDIYLE